MENPQFRNDGKGDFSTSERAFNNTETHLEAVVNRTTYDVSHDSSLRIKVADFQEALKLKNIGLDYQGTNQILLSKRWKEIEHLQG